jgi:long-chain acyl-CoA synthetase
MHKKISGKIETVFTIRLISSFCAQGNRLPCAHFQYTFVLFFVNFFVYFVKCGKMVNVVRLIMETIQDLGTYTFPALFRNSVNKFGDCPALSLVNGEPVTYRRLAAQVKQVAKMLAGLGLRQGSKTAIFSTSMPNWGAAYFAVVNYGGIAVPLLPDFSAAEVEAIILHCGVDALIVSESLYKRIEGLGEKLPPVIIKIDNFSVIRGGDVVKKISAAKNLLAFSINEALSENSIKSIAAVDTSAVYAEDFFCVTLNDVTVNEEDTASIIYTSGTTGRSKGVELTHKNLVWNAVQGQTIHRINKFDRCLSFLPMSHVYEFTIDFTMQIMNGSCVYYLGKAPTVSALLPAFSKVRPTIVCSVPMIIEKLYKNKVLPEINKNKVLTKMYKIPLFRKIINRKAGKKLKAVFGGWLQFFGIGGAKVDMQVECFMKEAKFPYAIGYGLTETSPLLAGSGPSETIPGTIGGVLDGVELAILNPNPETKVGEVIVRGPNVMKGYYKDPVLTGASFTTEDDSCGAGWFRTGDLGIIEKKHGMMRLSLKGRSKNMILGQNGENIYPEDIEFVLNQYPLVSESLVVEGKDGLVALVHFDEEKLQAEAERRAALQARVDAVRSGEMKFRDAVGETLSEAVQNAKMAATARNQDLKATILYQRASILNEIQYFVNSRVNRTSKISSVESIDEFEKTASQKIKRYLYSRKDKDTKKK